MRLRNLLFFVFVVLCSKANFASHVMGGEITWVCLGGGQFQFDLVIYRDCNGLEIVDASIDLEVWNHSSVTSISCDLFDQVDLSPNCTEVGGGPAELDCGSGTGGGTGTGAVQKYIYRSASVFLGGTPPPQGWTFTYDSFSRNWDLTNIQDPATVGLTLWATMYDVAGADANPCTDSSPQFAQDPYMLLCNGTDFSYDANVYDPDNDSLSFSWGIPYEDFTGVLDFGTNPIPVAFEPGYSFTNPTPDPSFDPSNVAASMDPETGEVNFTSFTNGNFGMVQQINSYRNGELIATINREIQMIVIPCIGYVNTAPTITPPFAGGTSWEATFDAGDLINFNIDIDDLELLQDGSPQTVTLEPTGSYFGTGLTDATTGCEYAPCATLSSGPIITGVQGVNTTFNWQTSCDHLLDADGVQQESQTYTFVLKVQDDYCQVPGYSYETIKITLLNKPLIDPVDLHCVDVLPNGDVELTWGQTTDISSSFIEYEIWSLEDGFIADIPAIGTEGYTVVGADCDLGPKHYYVDTRFGCAGGNTLSSDTLQTMFLEMTDLADGRVGLEWNNTHDPINEGDNGIDELWREYTSWENRKEVSYGTNYLVDTVDICSAFLSYEIRVDNDFGCTSTSNDPGMDLEDEINPDIPTITFVSVNTVTENVDIEWNVNPALDTYGYIIYTPQFGIWTEFDTVWGRVNAQYSHLTSHPLYSADENSATYRVAAFDSCLTASFPPTFQTSAQSIQHSTIFLTVDYNICAKSNRLQWTAYDGWASGVDFYEVWVSIEGSPLTMIAEVDAPGLSYNHTGLAYDATYQYVVRGVSTTGEESFSNRIEQFTAKPSQPDFHYISTATHTLGNDIEVKLYTDGSALVEGYDIERLGPNESSFEYLNTINSSGSDLYAYYDGDVFPERGPYHYRINLIDSCGRVGETTNIAKTIFLTATVNDEEMLVTLGWSAYEGFDGDIVQYNIYRGINGVFEKAPIATTGPGTRTIVDDVNEFFESEGQFCYRVEAVEQVNTYSFSETSFSNTACVTLEPIVYIPNAFMLNGINNVFLPVVNLYDYSSYDLSIFDRWGGQVFNTTDPNEGWRGLNETHGGYHQEGVYVYFLRIEDRDGVDYEFRGTVTFLIAE